MQIVGLCSLKTIPSGRISKTTTTITLTIEASLAKLYSLPTFRTTCRWWWSLRRKSEENHLVSFVAFSSFACFGHCYLNFIQEIIIPVLLRINYIKQDEKGRPPSYVDRRINFTDVLQGRLFIMQNSLEKNDHHLTCFDLHICNLGMCPIKNDHNINNN